MSQAYHQHFAKLRRSALKADLHQRTGLDSSAVLKRGLDVKKQKQGAKIWIVVAGGFFMASAFGLLWDEDFASMLPQVHWSWVTEGYAIGSGLGADRKNPPIENVRENQAQASLEASNESPKESAEGSALGPLIELQSRLK
ncbi:MAG: hypothetical protein N2Z70_06425, partial [Bdellovibrionaceae bacterium]|nr:hypothetical protein [Pseudobdellovibrionaceae bacterium]